MNLLSPYARIDTPRPESVEDQSFIHLFFCDNREMYYAGDSTSRIQRASEPSAVALADVRIRDRDARSIVLL